MGLDGASSREIAQYLCRTTDGQISRRLRDEPKIKPAELDAGKVIRDLATLDNAKQWVEVGRQLFATKGCVQCHQVKEKSAPVPSIPSWESVQKKRNAGCLAPDSKAGTHPSYPLTVGERDAIQTVLASVSSAEMIHRTTAPDPRHTLKRLMCLNCHSRDGEGGLAASLADRMKMLESAENADDVRPPSLTHIGHKATPEWLNSVLLKGGRARPWMGLRMPQYGAFHAASLVNGLAQLEGIHHSVPATKPTFDANLIAAGRTLTGKDGYGCITCHDIAGVAGGGTRGPDIALTFDRVRPEWFERWMHNPQRLSPGTKMPQYYIDGRAQNDVLGGDVSKQIHAIRAYLSLGPGLSLPVGMEPPKGLTITVTDRPVVLRTFMPEGAGTRPIAVGLPGGVNFAFDSTNGRLGYVWMGNFLDTSPVWNNRGGQPAKLLGARQWDAPNRIPWTVGSQPNFENVNPPDHVPVTNPAESAFHFDGYHVDRNGAPVFQSVLRGPTKPIKVSESISGLRNPLANGLSRTITWNSDDPIWFLAGETEGEPVIINTEGQRQTVKPKDGIVTVPVTGSRVVLPFAGNRAMLYDASTARLDAVWHFSPRPGGGWQLALKLPPSGPLTWSMWILPNNDERLIRELK
jgi:cytochrome c551/c552